MKQGLGFWLVILCIIWGMMLVGIAEAMPHFGLWGVLGMIAGSFALVVTGSLAVVLMYDLDGTVDSTDVADSDKL
jgi:membrane-bound ClpP family serine protease